MTYSVTLKVTNREKYLIVNYDETEHGDKKLRDMQSAIELLVIKVCSYNTCKVKFEYIDDLHNEITISGHVDYETSLAEVGQAMELIEQQLIENPR